MSVLSEQYQKEIVPKLKEEFGVGNVMALPKLERITVNVGVGRAQGDKKIIEQVSKNLARITGQKAILVKARKSISNFKLREGMVVGVMVTLRGEAMYDFMYKLVNITLPQVRDFQGINRSSVDAHGNLNIGFKEHIVFPEISSDEIEQLHGLEVSMTTTTNSREQGFRLFELLGVPFKKDGKKSA